MIWQKEFLFLDFSQLWHECYLVRRDDYFSTLEHKCSGFNFWAWMQLNPSLWYNYVLIFLVQILSTKQFCWQGFKLSNTILMRDVMPQKMLFYGFLCWHNISFVGCPPCLFFRVSTRNKNNKNNNKRKNNKNNGVFFSFINFFLHWIN